MQIAFPFHPDGRRRTALAGEDAHIRDLIEQVLFTHPGERVNRPDFGSGLGQLVFGPASTEMAATLQAVVHGALQQWLADRVRVEQVEVQVAEERLIVRVVYSRFASEERRVTTFERGLVG